MNFTAWEFSNSIAQHLVYFALLFLGVYFIYAGEIVQKFSNKRTTFAEYGEPVSELPTIQTSIGHFNQRLVGRKDSKEPI